MAKVVLRLLLYPQCVLLDWFRTALTYSKSIRPKLRRAESIGLVFPATNFVSPKRRREYAESAYREWYYLQLGASIWRRGLK